MMPMLVCNSIACYWRSCSNAEPSPTSATSPHRWCADWRRAMCAARLRSTCHCVMPVAHRLRANAGLPLLLPATTEQVWAQSRAATSRRSRVKWTASRVWECLPAVEQSRWASAVSLCNESIAISAPLLQHLLPLCSSNRLSTDFRLFQRSWVVKLRWYESSSSYCASAVSIVIAN